MTQDNALTEQAQMVIAYLNEKTGKRFRGVESALRMIRARLKSGYTLAELNTVIDNKCNDHYFRENPQYLNPTTLFGSDNKVEKYLNENADFGDWKGSFINDKDRAGK